MGVFVEARPYVQDNGGRCSVGITGKPIAAVTKDVELVGPLVKVVAVNGASRRIELMTKDWMNDIVKERCREWFGVVI